MKSDANAIARGFALPKPAPRTPIPATDAAKFEGTPAPSRRRRPERGERIAVYLPPEIVEALRVRCARERRSLSDAITEAVGTWVSVPK